MVSFKDVTKIYKNKVHALRGVSFDLKKGEFVSIIGPSGSGKTTILRLINGSEKPTLGSIYIEDKKFNGLKGREKRKIQSQTATIFQDFCLVEETSAIQNVLNADLVSMPIWKVLLGLFSESQKTQAMECLKKADLEEKANSLVSELSGGQKQRVAVAKALMQKASLVLADEPVASLDPVSSETVLHLLKTLQKEKNISVLMNSHNVELAMKYSDKIIGLRNGVISFFCKPSEITSEMLEELYRK